MGTFTAIQTAANHRVGQVSILFFAMACVLAPRLWDIGHPSFTYDELGDYLGSIRFADHPTMFGPVSEGYSRGQLPFFCASMVYKLFGRSETAARLQSVAVSLMAILLAFLIVEKLHGFWFGLLALVLLGLCPFYLSASRLAFSHGHVFCTLPLLGGIFFLQRLHHNVTAHNHGRANCWYAGTVGICMGVATGSDLIAGFWIASVLIVMHVWVFRTCTHSTIDYLKFFAIGCVLGIAAASPMYLAGLPDAAKDVAGRFKSLNGQSGYLWLGGVVKQIPLYYYGVVLLTRLTPVVLTLVVLTIVLYVRRLLKPHPFCLILLFSGWPLFCLSASSWKTPYYLIPFIPTLYIVLVDGLRMAFSTSLFRSRRYLAAIVILSLLASQAYAVISMHPDYLMQGIQYSDRLYGEYQGPAVSHGQWIGEAFSFIKGDCGDQRGFVYAVGNVGTPQIRHYASKHDLPTFIGVLPPDRLEDEVATKCSLYILVTRDAKEMICPAHKDAVRENQALVSCAENADVYSLVRTYYSGGAPMLWIYRYNQCQPAALAPTGSIALFK